MEIEKRFWMKSYDEGLTDIDPKSWETTYIKATRHIYEKYPNKMALEFLGIEITFGELDTYSSKFANMLIKQGLKPGDIVGICLANIPQYVISILGALKAGCVITGVSPLLSKDQIAYQLKDCGAKAFITLDAVFAGHLVKIADDLPDLQLVLYTSVGDFLSKIKAFLGKLIGKIPKGKITPLKGKTILNMMEVIKTDNYSSDLPEIEVNPDDLAYVLYTGGTTGPPKGAMLTHQNAVSDLLIVQNWLSWEEGKGLALSAFPMFHVAGLFFCTSCLWLGWSQILIPNPRDGDHICDCIEKFNPSVIANVPSLYQILLKNPKFLAMSEDLKKNLEVCISAAAPFPKESQEELERIIGRGKVLEVYGMTETAPLTTMNPSKGEKKLGTIGLPLLNTEIKLLDPATGEEVGLGEPGELCVKGPQVMKGYWNKPEETAKAIDQNRFMHTGDVAIFNDDGFLKIVDRTKDMIIVGGYKVFSSKLEDTMCLHPAIDQIATVGIPNKDRPGSEIVMAYVSPPEGYSIEDKDSLINEIVNWTKTKVSPYEVPKIIEFRDELPLTLVGKVDKKVLRQEAREKFM
ncbi:MAG: long-chain fatty acid--CoA ligase [archaeon]|nr:long-chain fatty acid--CoA ligase [archaeon]